MKVKMASTNQAKIENQIRTLVKLLKEYTWLTNAYMLDYFTCDHFKKLPQSWRDLFAAIRVEDFSFFLNWGEPLPGAQVWPLSLLALRQIMETNTVCRQQNSECITCNNYQIPYKNPHRTACFRHQRLKNLFLKHVKIKKRYEIETMAAETAMLAQSMGVKWVVDIGSGLGHLCRTLAYGYGLNVIGVETQNKLSMRARKLDLEVEVTASKHLTEDEMTELTHYRPHHKERTIDFCSDQHSFTDLIADCAGKEENFGIVGLHPCGNLAAILLRIYAECPKAKFICVISCCYHKITLSDSGNTGFPLSRAVALENGFLSVEAAALGSHAIESYSERLRSGDYEHLKVHCYRATLERIIVRRWPENSRSGLNNVSYYPGLSFLQYCEKALKRLGKLVDQEDLELSQTGADLAQWKETVFFHSLWLMLGPAVETVILLDRLLFLIEKGIPCRLRAAFDPLVSPRNFILTAIKPF